MGGVRKGACIRQPARPPAAPPRHTPHTLSHARTLLLLRFSVHAERRGRSTVHHGAAQCRAASRRPQFFHHRSSGWCTHAHPSRDADLFSPLHLCACVCIAALRCAVCACVRVLFECCQIDLNKDGRLSAAEIQQALGVDADEVKQMIAEVDNDGNGEVDFDEFITMWSLRSENDSAAAAAAAKKP